jgi:hypothetical protein
LGDDDIVRVCALALSRVMSEWVGAAVALLCQSISQPVIALLAASLCGSWCLWSWNLVGLLCPFFLKRFRLPLRMGTGKQAGTSGVDALPNLMRSVPGSLVRCLCFSTLRSSRVILGDHWCLGRGSRCVCLRIWRVGIWGMHFLTHIC